MLLVPADSPKHKLSTSQDLIMNAPTRILTTGVTAAASQATLVHSSEVAPSVEHTASTITTVDGVQLYYKDWGPKDGQVVTFSHGWPLNSDSWESQMMFLADKG